MEQLTPCCCAPEQRQNEQQIIPETIPDPALQAECAQSEQAPAQQDVAATDMQVWREHSAINRFRETAERTLFEDAMYRRVAHLMPDRALFNRMFLHKDENGEYRNPADMAAWDMWQVGRALQLAPQAPIPVSERLPEEGQDVLFKVERLIFGGSNEHEINGRWLAGHYCSVDGKARFGSIGALWIASHWLPMPPQCKNDTEAL